MNVVRHKYRVRARGADAPPKPAHRKHRQVPSLGQNPRETRMSGEEGKLLISKASEEPKISNVVASGRTTPGHARAE